MFDPGDEPTACGAPPTGGPSAHLVCFTSHIDPAPLTSRRRPLTRFETPFARVEPFDWRSPLNFLLGFHLRKSRSCWDRNWSLGNNRRHMRGKFPVVHRADRSSNSQVFE